MLKLGTVFASTGLSADFWTWLGLIISMAAGIGYASTVFTVNSLLASLIGGSLLLISGFFDVVDGNVARVTKKTSNKGAFLDSTFDKIAEMIIFAGIALGNLANPILCLLALGMSLLVSYSRSRAESLGVSLQGIGFGERAERLLIIAIASLIPLPGALQWGVIIVIIVAAITLGQRIVVTAKKLST